MSELRKAPLPL
uniref:Uncharacterized protein n=1 Tax=Anguilla anguilla TaxID=7936 RepID=A0A0E9VYA0_ANGAN